MSTSDINTVERFIRFAAKSVQKLPVRTRTDIALGMLGWLPMNAYIEQRKLAFFTKALYNATEYVITTNI